MGRIRFIQALNALLMNGHTESSKPELQNTKQGARLVQNGSVLSEVLSEPGPTQSVFDILAAAIMLNNKNRVGILGFAAGGLIGPLRSMNGHQHLLGWIVTKQVLNYSKEFQVIGVGKLILFIRMRLSG